MTSNNQNPNTQHQNPEPVKSVDQLTERNIALIAELEASEHSKRTFTDRVVIEITGFCGRIGFAWLHLIAFSTWIYLNSLRFITLDPYPFNLLGLFVSMEAIFLATFILISQNRQARLSERRSHLDLQINLLSEQENTKMLAMLAEIHAHLGLVTDKEETEVLIQATNPQNMFKQIEEIIEEGGPDKQLP